MTQPVLGGGTHRGLTQPDPQTPVLDKSGIFRPRHAADDYRDIKKRTRNLWIPPREDPP
jgi:hypothetical protein